MNKKIPSYFTQETAIPVVQIDGPSPPFGQDPTRYSWKDNVFAFFSNMVITIILVGLIYLTAKNFGNVHTQTTIEDESIRTFEIIP